MRKYWNDAAFAAANINGRPALVVTLGGEAIAVATITADDDAITGVFFVTNPAKLPSRAGRPARGV